MKSKARVQTVGEVLEGFISRLEKTSDTPCPDVQVLMARVLGKPRSWVMAHSETLLTRRQVAELEASAQRLEDGEPLPYVLGRWEFFGLEFEVTPEVLIPRPETELLVETAISWLRKHPDQRRAADIGTGSGCIAIALAANVPELQVVAADISPSAVAIARRNTEKNGVERRVEVVCCDLLPAGSESYDLIVANLPYIPTPTLRDLHVFGREPSVALDGGADGLGLIRRLMAAAPQRLGPAGMLLVEIEASQGPAVLSLACDTFSEAEIHLHKDLTGRDRLLEVQV